jgi:hypothetical protein
MELFTTESYYNFARYMLKLQCGKKVYVISKATSYFPNYKIYFLIYLKTQ